MQRGCAVGNAMLKPPYYSTHTRNKTITIDIEPMKRHGGERLDQCCGFKAVSENNAEGRIRKRTVAV